MVYMKKIVKNLLPVIKGFVYCGIALQIVLGTIYIAGNMTTIPKFWETTIYAEIAEQFILDEYMTYLYPMLIKVVKILPFINYQIPIYLLQVFAGIFCVYKIATGWTDKKKTAVVCALWVNTLPFVAQAHVTVLPHSFVWTLIAITVSIVARATYHKEPIPLRDWSYLLIGFTLIAQLDKSYFVVTAILLIWAIGLQFYHKNKRILSVLVGFVACATVCACNLGIYQITQTDGYYGRMQRSVEAMLFQRVGMGVMTEDLIYYMPEEVKETFTGKELETLKKYPYQLQRTFGSTLEARFGKERANEIYLELGLWGLQNTTKDTVLAIATDTLNYAFPMGMYGNWDEDGNQGATSWNYQQFVANHPRLSAFYMHTAYILWIIGFAAGLIAGIRSVSRKYKHVFGLVMLLIIYILLYGLVFALRGTGMYDYKLALLPLALSQVPGCYCCIHFLKKRERKGLL